MSDMSADHNAAIYRSEPLTTMEDLSFDQTETPGSCSDQLGHTKGTVQRVPIATRAADVPAGDAPAK